MHHLCRIWSLVPVVLLLVAVINVQGVILAQPLTPTTAASTPVPTTLPTSTFTPVPATPTTTPTTPPPATPTPGPTPTSTTGQLIVELVFGAERGKTLGELWQRHRRLVLLLGAFLVIMRFLWKPVGEWGQARITALLDAWSGGARGKRTPHTSASCGSKHSPPTLTSYGRSWH